MGNGTTAKGRKSGTTAKGKKRPEGRRNLSTLREAAGLPEGYRVTRYQPGEGCDRMWVEKVGEPDRACPRCGAKGHLNGHYRRRVWHVPFRGGAQLCLLLDQARLRCPVCGRCWSDGHEGLVSEISRHMTGAVVEGIKLDLMARRSVKGCSQTWGPSRHLVNKVVEAAFVDWQYMPATLCIDELKADTDAGKMAIGIYDGDAGNIIELLPDMRRQTVDWFFDGFSAEERARVRYFCCDMSAEMIAVQRRWFPHAKLCLDRFHVTKLANEALRDVRRRVEADEAVPAELRRELKGSWKLLAMGREKLRAADDRYAMDMAEKRARLQLALDLADKELDSFPGMRVHESGASRLGRLLSLSDELRVAHALCHDLNAIQRAGSSGWWDGMPKELERWRSFCRQSGVPEMARLQRTVRRNEEGILNSYRYGKTNAVAEGINNSIKLTKRKGYGIRRFEAFRRRVLLALGLGRVEVLRLSIRDVSGEV